MSRIPKSAEERLRLAKLKTYDLIGKLSYLIEVQANADHLVYKPTLTDQIPRSYAANSYNNLQQVIVAYQAVRLCSVWQKIDANSSSIPTIVHFADNDDVLSIIHQEHAASFGPSHYRIYDEAELSPSEKQASINGIKVDAADRADTQIRRLRLTFDRARKIQSQSERLKRLENFRTKEIAHHLAATNRERKSGPIMPARYGDEVSVLNATIAIANRLYLGINGVSFDWDEAKEIAERNASQLWSGAKLNIPTRERKT